MKRKVTTPAVVKKFNHDDDPSEDLYFPQETQKRKSHRKDNRKPPQLPQLQVNDQQVPLSTVNLYLLCTVNLIKSTELILLSICIYCVLSI